jgi:hypothetical protein
VFRFNTLVTKPVRRTLLAVFRNLIIQPLAAAGMFAVALTLPAAPIQVDVPQVSILPVVDGILEAQPLQKALDMDLVRVGSMDRPEDATTVSALVSREGIYLAFQCLDRDPSKIASRVVRENGPVFEDDSIQVFLSPGMETGASNYIHLALNSIGTKYSNDLANDRPVEGWTGMARTTGTGWEAEVFVPMKAFGGDLRVSRIWRGNVARVRTPRANGRVERSAWVDPGVSLHNYRRFGFIRVLDLSSSGNPQTASAVRTPAPLTSIGNSPFPSIPVPKPSILPPAGPTEVKSTPMANRAVIVEELPASARLMATREIMLATGKDLESVRLILLQLPATVATDLNQEQADKLQQALAVLGARVTLK